MELTEIRTKKDFTEQLGTASRIYLLLYKKGSEISECAVKNIKEAFSGLKENIKLFMADVNAVRDIHPEYGITTVPNLLIFENGNFKNSIKGCNANNYYKNIFEGAVFASVKPDENDEKPKHHVTVYTTPTCSWCNTLKLHLQKHRISYTEVDVSRDPRAAEDLMKKTGQQGVPQTDINGEIIVGFDKVKINKLLNIH